MKKIIALSLILFAFFAPAVSAQEAEMHFFYGNGCPHCAKEMEFLQELKGEFPGMEISFYEIYDNPDNASLLKSKAKELGITKLGVPFLIIDGEAVVGYLNEETTGRDIRGKVLGIMGKSGKNGELGSELSGEQDSLPAVGVSEKLETVSLPFLGDTEIGSWSLPLLTAVIAALDGFNPCAMWVLLFLISLLLCMEDRKKMWILGLSFIFISALVYFLFLTAWLNLFLFVGFLPLVRLAVGAVAIFSGFCHLREWLRNKEGTCHATSGEKKKKIMDRFRRVAEQKSFWLALGGITALAFAVNMIELVCSAGLPAIYTHVLSLSDISTAGYYLYLLLYIAIFMLDDMMIFAIAMVSLKTVCLSSKYSRWSNLIGGIIIFILGILLIFKPGWIMFG